MTDPRPQAVLITEEYRKLNAELHERKTKYGANGHDWADRVEGYITAAKATTYLDYGCGKGTLAAEIEKRFTHSEAGVVLGVFKYDPVTAPQLPSPADFVTCCDVLEHIEPGLLDNVLEHIAANTKTQALLVISQRKANKTLADGRNAHLIVKPTDWWVKQLTKHFCEVIEVEPIWPKRIGVELAVLVRPAPADDDGATTIELIKR